LGQKVRGGGGWRAVFPAKDFCRLLLPSLLSRLNCLGLLDSLSLSRHGESSSELVSVMILNPAFGNSLWKATVRRTVLTSHEQ
jgi:hypothetical protein